MSRLSFPYVWRSHHIFGTVLRPLLKLNLYSVRFGIWVALDEVLADTGADISVVPLPIGQLLVADISTGQPIQLGGVISSTAMFNAFLHRVPVKLGDKQFDMPLAVVTSSTIPPIFGRREALDQFEVRFIKGQELVIET